jgi:hypothetical protein
MQVDGRFVEQARRDLTALLAAHPELEEDDVLHVDMIEGNTKAFELLDELIRVERSAKILSEATEAEIERLKIRQGRFESRRAILRKYMMQLMEAANLKKAERPAATVSIAAGRPKVVITTDNVYELPAEFIRVKREFDKEAIAKALKEGQTVPGATLSNSEPVLRIS